MNLHDDIKCLKLQEEILRFTTFGEEDAWLMGSQMRALAKMKNLPLVIDIRIGSRPLFYTAIVGTTPENTDWVRRKINTVMRFHKSSYRVGREYLQKGNGFDASRGINVMDHADAGGGFPIFITGTGVIGTITVSGVPQREDHNFVVESIATYLKVNYTALALQPQSE